MQERAAHAARRGERAAVGFGLDRRWWRRWLPCAAAVLAMAGATCSAAAPSATQSADAAVTAAPSAAPHVASAAAAPSAGADVILNRRTIATLRTPLMGRAPAERAVFAMAALGAALQGDVPGQVTLWQEGDLAGLRVDGRIVFYLAPGDVDPALGSTLDELAAAARARLQAAVLEVREARDVGRIARGLALSAAASLVAIVLLRLAFRLRGRAVVAIAERIDRWRRANPGNGIVASYAHYGGSLARAVGAIVVWLIAIAIADLWITFVLDQFAYTRPWAERSRAWVLQLLAAFGSAILEAVPGLLTAILIFVLAAFATRALNAVLLRAERGQLQLSVLDRDTAGPTRRIAVFVIWLFALAIAFPFLPGAQSEAFKGVSVLAGLMLSLGASSVVGQIVSGISLMYSRALRQGEYVKIGDTEGTVASVGLFATRIHTGLGEEVSLPNAYVFAQPLRNFSRLVAEGQFVLHAAVTIGYATPWRQVHAMLLEAARRTPGVASDPPPFVVQTALSDFYVEYRLCAQSTQGAPRRRIEALDRLHANIQDVFNENGVQIMSPHYLGDPPAAQVVAPEHWAPSLVRTTRPDAPSPP